MGLFLFGIMSRDYFQNGGTFYSQSIGVINTMKNMSGTIEAVQHNRYSYNWILLNIKHKSEESEDNMVLATRYYSNSEQYVMV